MEEETEKPKWGTVVAEVSNLTPSSHTHADIYTHTHTLSFSLTHHLPPEN